MGNILDAFLRESQHGVVGADAEFGMDYLEIILLVGCVKADGHRINEPLELWGGMLLPDQVRKAVGIDADGNAGLGSDIGCHLQKVIQPLRGLAIAAENNLTVFVQIPDIQAFADLGHRGFPVQPQRVGPVYAVRILPQAEAAGAGTAVGHVDIDPVFHRIGNGHHVLFLLKCNL